MVLAFRFEIGLDAGGLLVVALVALKTFRRGEEGSHSPYSVKLWRVVEANVRDDDDACAWIEALLPRGAVSMRGFFNP